MAELINFNRAKKSRGRATAKAGAAANRVTFGRTKAEKAASKLDAARKAHELDGKKRGD